MWLPLPAKSVVAVLYHAKKYVYVAHPLMSLHQLFLFCEHIPFHTSRAGVSVVQLEYSGAFIPHCSFELLSLGSSDPPVGKEFYQSL